MRILGIESTCDETACAIVDEGRTVLADVVASSAELHAVYRGVVPEIAARAHIENLLPVIERALAESRTTLAQVDAIAVAHRPGLIGSLLVGLTAAKTLAWTLEKPLVGVDHVHAHLYSATLEDAEGRVPRSGTPVCASGATVAPRRTGGSDRGTQTVVFPAVGLVCSGGHTALYDVRDWTDVRVLGKTIDDAVGEAYDKVSAICGLGYPGGPILDRLAVDGDPRAVKFPRSLLAKDSLDFSFSGLKTAVLYHVRGYQGREVAPESRGAQFIKDTAASFQAACVDVLIEKLRRAIRATGAQSVIVGGGVSANRGLRAALATLDVPSFVPAMRFTTDNAAMIAGLGHVLLERGVAPSLDLDAATMSAIR